MLVLVGLLTLAACGKREALEPLPPRPLPQQPATAPTQPTVADLLTPAPQARPERSDELLRRSEERRQDRFDLPPPRS
jgi:hypothetical protein